MTEWGPWIEHDGKSRPVALGVMVEVESAARWSHDGTIVDGVTEVVGPLPCEDWEAWYSGPSETMQGLIVRYRIRKPRGLTILEELLTNLPEPVGEDA